MIEDTHNIQLDPRSVFGLENVTDKQVVHLMRELGVTGFDTTKEFQERTQSGIRTDLYIPYAVYHGYKEGLREIDLFSYTGLIAGFVTGLFGGFGTDTYPPQRVIENKLLDKLNQLRTSNLKLNPLDEAKLLVRFAIDDYKALNVKTVRRTVTLPQELVLKIKGVEGQNFSEKLRNILYEYFKEEKQ